MKIAYVIPDINTKGGIQQFASSVKSNLKNRHTIISIGYIYNLPYLCDKFLNSFPEKIGAKLFTYLFTNYFKKQLKLEEYDLIHFWHIDAAMAFIDKNYIVTCHGLEIIDKNVKFYKREMYKKVLNNAKHITADSQYTKELLIKNFKIKSSKIIVVYPGVETKLFDIPKIKHEGIVIGSLSRFVPRKNFINIIQSLQILHRKYKVNFIFHLAGEGPDKEIIINQLKNVTFKWKYWGAISDEIKIKEFYPALDLFVMPTLPLEDSIEGFGIVYLEANSAGIPVIAAPSGGVVDAVKEGVSGLFCDPKNPNDIASKISNILKKENIKKYNVKQWALNFDIKDMSDLFNTIYIN